MRPCVCNACGKTFLWEDDMLKEDVVTLQKKWGFFSRTDLEIHQLHLCEDCYDQWISTFKIPPVILKDEMPL